MQEEEFIVICSHRRGILDILKCEPTKEAVTSALLCWNAVDFETEASPRKMVSTALRVFSEWDKHPHGQALAGTPPVELRKIADAPKREEKGGFDQPLEDIRVLDLTRVLAGPVCGRTLAGENRRVVAGLVILTFYSSWRRRVTCNLS